MPSLSQEDFAMLIEQMGGDENAARNMLTQRGYTVEDGSADTGALGALPGAAGDLQGLLGQQRASIGNLYDKITANIEQRYRKPDINDLLVNIGMGMLTPPGPTGEGGFRGSLMRGLQGVGNYAAQQREYEQNINKMMSDVEIAKAKELADLESKYITSAAGLLKPRVPRVVGTQVVDGKVVTVFQDPDTGEVSTSEIGKAPTKLQPVPGMTANGGPVMFDPAKGYIDQYGNPVTEFDQKPRKISATEQKEIFTLEDNLDASMGAVGMLQDALALNQNAYEGSLSGWRKSIGSVFSSDSPEYVATEQLDNLLGQSALGQLRAIFGGNPTEGERKILMDLSTSSSKPRAVREAIITRAIEAAQARIKRTSDRLSRIKSGGYSGYSQPAPRGGAPKAGGKPRIINWGN